VGRTLRLRGYASGVNAALRQRLLNLGGLAVAIVAWTLYAVYLSPTQGWTFFFQLTVNGSSSAASTR
jgi:hypothetical protein